MWRRFRSAIGLLATASLLASCGGGGDNGGNGGGVTTGSPTTVTPTPTASAGCSLRARQDWVAKTMTEWYLFPDLLPTALDPAPYADVQDYIDALTATARAQRKDRYFTYLASVAEENAYYSNGATAGLGVRLGFGSSNRLLVIEAFEGAPALAAGVDRGAQIVAVGSSEATLRNIADILATEGSAGLDAAFGPIAPGTVRVLRISDANGVRNVTLTGANYEVSPVSSRYGSKVIDDNGRKIGYVNLRTFITSADDELRTAFAGFRAQGVTDVIVDLRYNGGGLVSTAQTLTDLLGASRSTSDVQSYATFRPSKSSENEVRLFRREAQAIAPTRIAFIGTGSTASASEYVINALIPYLHGNVALIGTNTYGKPVGQIAVDNPSCSDDRLRVIAFALQNAARQGDYYDGLATKVEASCQASDDVTRPMGDPTESATRAALDFIAGRSCTRIGASAAAERTAGLLAPAQRLLTPARPNAAQRETPGLF